MTPFQGSVKARIETPARSMYIVQAIYALEALSSFRVYVYLWPASNEVPDPFHQCAESDSIPDYGTLPTSHPPHNLRDKP